MGKLCVHTGCSTGRPDKAAASEEAKLTLRHVADLSEARMKLQVDSASAYYFGSQVPAARSTTGTPRNSPCAKSSLYPTSITAPAPLDVTLCPAIIAPYRRVDRSILIAPAAYSRPLRWTPDNSTGTLAPSDSVPGEA